MCRIKHEKRSCLLKKQLLVYLLKIVLFVGVHDSSLRHIICVLIIKNLAIWFKPTVSNDYLSVCMIAACAIPI